jgi:uncharacterized protein (DUF1697 family)
VDAPAPARPHVLLTGRASRYAAFLRGINLGPRRRVSGSDLRSLVADAGFSDVSTFRTSGNVVFTTEDGSAARVTRRIEAGLAESLGFEVTVFLRSADEMRALAGHQPFTASAVGRSKGKLQVILLGARPSASARGAVSELATPDDQIELGDREVYWLPSGGTRDSRLDLKAIEAQVGPTTMRTKGTLDELARKHFAT